MPAIKTKEPAINPVFPDLSLCNSSLSSKGFSFQIKAEKIILELIDIN